MATVESLQSEIEKIKARNERVEADKARETSWARKMTISILMYFVMAVFFYFANLPKPFVNAIVPSIALLFRH